jgi:hypothetical protein
MSALSMGRTAGAGGSEAPPVVPSSGAQMWQDAIAKTLSVIPTEGVAVYIGTYALALSSVRAAENENPGEVFAWFCVAAGAFINALVMFVGFRPGWGQAKDRGAMVFRFTWRLLAATALLLTYIATTPQNPFLIFFDFPINAGLAVAIVASAVLTALNWSGKRT